MMGKFFTEVWAFPVTRVVCFLLLLLGSIFLFDPIIFHTLKLSGGPITPSTLLVYEIFHLFVCFSIFWFFVTKVEHSNLSKFGFRAENAFPDVMFGIGFGAILVVLIVAAMYFLGVYHPIKFNSPHDLLFSCIALLFAAATEELIFRAYIFTVFEKSWGTIAALALSSIGFGFAHICNDAGGSALIDKILFCTFLSFEAGLTLAACYVLTRRLWMPIAAHWIWNFFEGPVFGTHVSGADFGTSWIDAKVIGADVLTGGKFGPEGSVICLLIGTAGGAALLWLALKHHQFFSSAEAKQRFVENPETNGSTHVRTN